MRFTIAGLPPVYAGNGSSVMGPSQGSSLCSIVERSSYGNTWILKGKHLNKMKELLDLIDLPRPSYEENIKVKK